MLISMGLILIGFVLLYYGAEGLVKGSSSLALRLKITPLAIGLTVVAFGTSMPEMIVSIKSSLTNHGDISIGNVLGSNIFNIAVILGISSLVRPLHIKYQLVKYDAPIMILVSFLFLFFFRDFQISRFEGAIFFILFVIYTIANFYVSKKEYFKEKVHEVKESDYPRYKHIYIEILLIIGGLVLLVLGANYLINGSIKIARFFGISEAIIGLTIIATGTSLPELATSVVAAMHKESDIAVGNIIGSCIFNILSILGVASLIMPISGAGISMVDVAVMIATSVILLPLLYTGWKLNRGEGTFLLCIYGAYLFYLFQKI